MAGSQRGEAYWEAEKERRRKLRKRRPRYRHRGGGGGARSVAGRRSSPAPGRAR